jgi:hypothetical protein
MRVDPDRALLGASLGFAGAAVLGSVVAIRDQLPGQPLGVSIPLSVPAGLAAGWGAAVAAPCRIGRCPSTSPSGTTEQFIRVPHAGARAGRMDADPGALCVASRLAARDVGRSDSALGVPARE